MVADADIIGRVKGCSIMGGGYFCEFLDSILVIFNFCNEFFGRSIVAFVADGAFAEEYFRDAGIFAFCNEKGPIAADGEDKCRVLLVDGKAVLFKKCLPFGNGFVFPADKGNAVHTVRERNLFLIVLNLKRSFKRIVSA